MAHDYLRYSYEYYILHDPSVPDVVYDRICRVLLENYEKIPQSPYKHIIDREALSAGTGFMIRKSEYEAVGIS